MPASFIESPDARSRKYFCPDVQGPCETGTSPQRFRSQEAASTAALPTRGTRTVDSLSLASGIFSIEASISHSTIQYPAAINRSIMTTAERADEKPSSAAALLLREMIPCAPILFRDQRKRSSVPKFKRFHGIPIFSLYRVYTSVHLFQGAEPGYPQD